MRLLRLSRHVARLAETSLDRFSAGSMRAVPRLSGHLLFFTVYKGGTALLWRAVVMKPRALTSQ